MFKSYLVLWPCHTVAYERNVRVAYEIFTHTLIYAGIRRHTMAFVDIPGPKRYSSFTHRFNTVSNTVCIRPILYFRGIFIRNSYVSLIRNSVIGPLPIEMPIKISIASSAKSMHVGHTSTLSTSIGDDRVTLVMCWGYTRSRLRITTSPASDCATKRQTTTTTTTYKTSQIHCYVHQRLYIGTEDVT